MVHFQYFSGTVIVHGGAVAQLASKMCDKSHTSGPPVSLTVSQLLRKWLKVIKKRSYKKLDMIVIKNCDTSISISSHSLQVKAGAGEKKMYSNKR